MTTLYYMHYSLCPLCLRLTHTICTFFQCQLFAEEINMNLKLAVCASLLLLPESFSMHSLLYKVAELSYGGDIRVGVAEDPYKVMINKSLLNHSKKQSNNIERYLTIYPGKKPCEWCHGSISIPICSCASGE